MSIRIKLPEKEERAFREAAMRRYGFKKGAINAAGVEAITLWLKHNVSQVYPRKIQNPTEKLRGMLEFVMESSVELQHKASFLCFEESAE